MAFLLIFLDFMLKTMDLLLKMMEFLLKMMSFVLKNWRISAVVVSLASRRALACEYQIIHFHYENPLFLGLFWTEPGLLCTESGLFTTQDRAQHGHDARLRSYRYRPPPGDPGAIYPSVSDRCLTVSRVIVDGLVDFRLIFD